MYLGLDGVQVLESEVTDTGRTTLPRAVLEALSLEDGGRVRYLVTDGTVRMLASGSAERLAGALQYDGPPITVEEMDRAIAEGAAETLSD